MDHLFYIILINIVIVFVYNSETKKFDLKYNQL